MITVTGPNGETVEFPDGTDEATIDGVMRQQFQPTQAQPASPQAIQETLIGGPKPRQTEPHGIAQKIAWGISQPIIGVAQMAASAMPGNAGATFNRQIGKINDEWQANRRLNNESGVELLSALGSGITTAPLAAALPTGAGMGLLGKVGAGALQGGLLGATNPVMDPNKDFAQEKGKQIAIGMGTGGAVSGGMDLLGRAISPRVTQNVAMLKERGVTPTIGQHFGKAASTAEDALSSVNPLVTGAQRRAVGEFNVAAYNEALKPIGERYAGKAGHDGIAEVGNKLSNAYNELLPTLKFQADKQFVDDLTEINSNLSTMVEPKQKQFVSILEKYLKPNINTAGTMTGDQLKKFESQMNAQIARFDKPNATVDDLDVADGLKDVLTAVRDAVERTNPDKAAQLKSINNGWAVLTRLERAVNTASDEGVFTPAQLMQSVRASDSSVRHRAFARGEALLQPLAEAGKSVLGNRYPDSGTAGRLLAGAAGLALGGGAATVNPGAGAIAALSALGYTRPGQRAASALFTSRPDFAPQVAQGLERARPALIPLAPFLFR
jgi:hypothetical protein